MYIKRKNPIYDTLSLVLNHHLLSFISQVTCLYVIHVRLYMFDEIDKCGVNGFFLFYFLASPLAFKMFFFGLFYIVIVLNILSLLLARYLCTFLKIILNMFLCRSFNLFLIMILSLYWNLLISL